MNSSAIPTDGPETVLGQAARQLGLRYSRTHVARAVVSHREPTSLLALVEVARDLGIKVTAGKVDPDELGDLEGPTIVHFLGPAGGGFGVLQEATPAGFKVWDSVNGAHVIARDAFLAQWSGVIALVERAEQRGAREKGYLRNRSTELIFSGYEPPAIVAGRAATALRVALGALVVVLLGLAAATVASEDRLPAGSIATLSLVGLLVTIVTGVSIGSQDGTLSDRICARGKYVDCHGVLSSRYSRIIGIPLSDIGIAFFGGLVLLLATGALGRAEVSVWTLAGLLYVASVPVSLLLVGVQIAMRQLCTLCLAVHTVNLASAAIFWIGLRPTAWPTTAIVRALLLFLLFFLLLLFFAIPYFRKHQGLRVLAGMHRRISSSPFSSLAEVLTEDPSDLEATECAVRLGGAGAHELVVFVHPSCGKCDPVLQQVRALAQAGMVTAYVGLAPKDPEESDRRACSAVIAAGLSGGPERLIEAYAAAKNQLRTLMAGDPVTVLATELGVDPATIAEAVEDAALRTRAAEDFVDAHAEGTPTVFFDARLYRGELTHLAFLLENHPNLLVATLPAPAEEHSRS